MTKKTSSSKLKVRPDEPNYGPAQAKPEPPELILARELGRLIGVQLVKELRSLGDFSATAQQAAKLPNEEPVVSKVGRIPEV